MIFNLPFFKKKNTIKPFVLVILDGFGIAPASQGNAISLAKIPYYTNLLSLFPHTELIASGESVGLPANEVGNTEVGHLTLGAGRTMLQDLKRINLDIERGTIFDNRALLDASAHVKKNGSKIHILGLVSSGNVHSSLNHLYAILQFCKKEGLKDVILHIFTDGRDASPKEGEGIINVLESHLKLVNIGKIATVSGRYFAMDRDKRWERTERAYNAIVSGVGVKARSAAEGIKNSYNKGQTDEFVEPTVIEDARGPVGLVNDNDAVVFFNYRIDRPRQLTMAFVHPQFEDLKEFSLGSDPQTYKSEHQQNLGQTFKRQKILKNVFFVTMTEYHKDLPVSAVAFKPELVQKSFAEVVSLANLKQIKMAESEKERFVTYYFNGMREGKFEGENQVIIASPNVPTYDQKPEMSLPTLVKEFLKYIQSDTYHVGVVNFANADMVGHSGNLQKTVKAVEYIDRYLSELVEGVLRIDGTVFITADHGNSEELITYPSSTYFFTTDKGSVNTDHSNNPVPFVVINNSLKGNKSASLSKGALADVAPTILAMMGIEKPAEMTGKNLLVRE